MVEAVLVVLWLADSEAFADADRRGAKIRPHPHYRKPRARAAKRTRVITVRLTKAQLQAINKAGHVLWPKVQPTSAVKVRELLRIGSEYVMIWA